MTLAIEIERGSPLRALDWRWRMAGSLHQRGVRSAELNDDAWLAAALRFLENRERRPDLACGADDPGFSLVGEALAVCQSPAAIRGTVQAGILSHELSDATARRAGLRCPEVVDVYESVFFAVRDRLSARGWIHLAAITFIGQPDTPEERRGRLLRRLAYRGGPVVLDQLLAALRLGPFDQPADPRMVRLVRALELLEVPDMSIPVALELVGFRSRLDHSFHAQTGPKAPEFDQLWALIQPVLEAFVPALDSIPSPGPETAEAA